ncbi:unnamed protein product [Medioppia subpectinata]|uniref:Uncharacterized protein n=1 Tax=Medioppia subpectinata TaxID=1979941 RepID=A0A7R9KCC3_9ACAR|nr:unnamed protein product [Medioppia subpectinata]CAG2100038.1 unnamed protein product [Medioppia subpectinata]
MAVLKTDTNNNIESKLADFDITSVKWERGVTPQDIKEKCHDLCQDYLGGVWLKAGIDEVVVTRLSGGLTNQLYLCQLNDQYKNSVGVEPNEVAIRLYQGKHFNNLDHDGNERLTDVIIALIMSEKGLGPKIYGLFEGGQIQKFYKHKGFRVEQQNDIKLVQELAQKLARIHSTVVPIKKNSNWIFDFFDNTSAEAYKLFDINALIDECKCQTFKAHDIREELDWLKTIITAIDSPITFSHIDFRGSNIMVTESDGIVVCDFEYSCNGNRGYDFGTLFAEWGRELADFAKPPNFPDDSAFKPFIDEYIKESTIISGNDFSEDPRNSCDHILKEGKIFSLISYMFMVLLSLKASDSFVSEIPFDKKEAMIFTDMFYKHYYLLKEKFILDKSSKFNNKSFDFHFKSKMCQKLPHLYPDIGAPLV